MKKILLASLIAIASTGCATRPATEAALNFSPSKEELKTFIASHMKDPSSLKVKDFRYVVRRDKLTQRDYVGGVCVQINAKNSYGGYTGFKGVVVQNYSGKLHFNNDSAYRYNDCETRPLYNPIK